MNHRSVVHVAALTVAVAASLAGCDRDAAYRAALPQANHYQLSVPGPSTGAAASPVHAMTRKLGDTVDSGARYLFDVVAAMADSPSSTQTETSRVFGPFTPGIPGLYDTPVTYRLVITRVDDEHHRFSLDGRSSASKSDADFTPLLDGHTQVGHLPSEGQSGHVTLHFDPLHRLVDVLCVSGTLDIAYEDGPAGSFVDETLRGYSPQAPLAASCDAPAPLDARYRVERDSDGAGRLLLSAADPDLGSLDVHGGWLPSGAGRIELVASIAPGSMGGAAGLLGDLAVAVLGAPEVSMSECWGVGFDELYSRTTPTSLRAASGDESACALDASLRRRVPPHGAFAVGPLR